MSITATELKENLSRHLLLVEKADISISRNRKVVVESDSSFQDKEKLVEELFASVPSTMTLEEAKSERRKKIGKS
jgi:prevent-host-death family protein